MAYFLNADPMIRTQKSFKKQINNQKVKFFEILLNI